MLKKAFAVMATLLLAASLNVGTFTAAQAGHHHHGRNGAAIVGGAVLGILALEALSSEQRARGCYEGPRRCHWVPRRCRENDWGERVCRGGHEECSRRVVCD